MARLFWDDGTVQSHARAEFDPAEYGGILARLSETCGTALELVPEKSRQRSELPYFPVRIGGRRSGWGVSGGDESEAFRRAAAVAADVISRMSTAEQDMASLAMELADRYEELNFLYDMGDRVGGLLDEDEVCHFVVEEAAWLMNCERASIMLADADEGELKIRAAVGLSDQIADEVAVRPGERISGKVFESGHGVIVNEGDPMPVDSLNVRELRESNCFLSVPLKIGSQPDRKEQILGVFNLTRKREGSMFTASDLKLVSAVAATTATQIHNCRLINAERERQQLEHELELAAHIQLSLLPAHPLQAGAGVLAGDSKAAQHAGGDLFDYWLQDDHVCLVVADVSGHDMGAALMVTAFRSVIRSEAAHRRTVAGLMSRVNQALFEDLVHSELFISCFYAEIELASGLATFCRAGHPKPLLMQLEEKGWLDTEGMLLGVGEDGEFEERSIRLERGDTVVLYTDGLLEARDREERFFGTDGVRKAALGALASPAKEMAERIVAAAREYTAPRPIADDMTVLVVRYGQTSGK